MGGWRKRSWDLTRLAATTDPRQARLGFDTAIFTALPPPVLYVTLGILGIVLWANMTEECDDFYGANHGLLLGIFHIQGCIRAPSRV